MSGWGLGRCDPAMASISPSTRRSRSERPLLVVLDTGRPQQRRRARIAVPAGFVDGALDPADARQVDAILVDQVAPDPDRGRHRIERNADALAGQLLRAANAGLAIDVDVAVPEHARRKHRQRHERTSAARQPADEFRAGELGDVEFLIAAHAVEDLARRFDGQKIEVDPLDADVAGAQRIGAIVNAAGKRQSQSGHVMTSRMNGG